MAVGTPSQNAILYAYDHREGCCYGKRGQRMSQFPKGAFRRYDETPDERFYRTPRLVTHINAQNYKTA
jgi:hypothetical protein